MTDAHPPAVARDAVRGRLEEEFRALRRIDPVVEVTAARVVRLLDARRPASVIRDARRPDFLADDRRQNLFAEIGKIFFFENNKKGKCSIGT